MDTLLKQRRSLQTLRVGNRSFQAHTLLRIILSILGVALLVLAANLLAGRMFAQESYVALGTRADRALISGMHGPERDSLGTTYRWSNGDAQIKLYGPATSTTAILQFELGWLPPDVVGTRSLYLYLDDRSLVRIELPNQPRRYRILQPEHHMDDGLITLRFRSESSIIPPDDRPLGIRIDAIGLDWNHSNWPLPPLLMLGAQAGMALAWLGLARRFRLGDRAAVPVAAILIAALALAAAYEPHLAQPYQLRLLVGGLVSCGVVLLAGTALEHSLPDAPNWFIRALLLITLAALAIRLIGVLYPSFLSHDLWVNGRRLHSVQTGTLTLFDRPSEFSRRVVPVSPSAFLLAAPLGLIGDRGIALHGLYSVLDGTSAVLVAVLARRVGLSWGAALVAAALIAALPMQMTALYWGFVKQIVGQWLTLLLLVVVAGPTPTTRMAWLAIGALCCVNLLIHPGGLLLSGVCLGLYVIIGGGAQLRASWRQGSNLPTLLKSAELAPWRGWLYCFGGAALAALALQYADAAILVIGGMISGASESPLGTNQQSDQAARLWQIWVGLRASFEPLTLLLTALSIPALFQRARGNVRLLAACWLAAAACFLVVDLVSGQQVRYAYFIAPLVCVGVAALCERLLRLPLGRAAVGALITLVAIQGSHIWLAGALQGVRMSVNPLTH